MTRRDLLLWGAGAAAGIVVTPIPWKLLDDVSIWTQNWPWIPQPARGPVNVQASFCNLCPHGCGLRVRTVQGWPVGIAGSPQNPITRGALCPLAFAAHQLNWHPQRLRNVKHRGSDATWAEAQAAFSKACSEGAVEIVDGHPGRAASLLYQAFVQNRRGAYQAVPSPETQSLQPYEAWTGVPASDLGYDLENAHTIVSLGAPMLDGWGTPGRFTRLWAERAAGSADPSIRLIQVDAQFSRTAARAWQWVQITPGGETALASGLARVLVEEHLVAAKGPMPRLQLNDAASQAGVSAEAIRAVARQMMAKPPVLIIAQDANPAVAALNVLLGALGAKGGIVRKSKRNEPATPVETPGGPVRAMLIDASVPWDFNPKTDAEVFRFAAWDGGSTGADWLLPAAGFLEETTDVPTAPALAVETYAIAPAMVKPAVEIHSAVEMIAAVDSLLPAVDKMIHSRCEAIFRDRKGTLVGAQTTPVAKVESAQKLEEQLRKGAMWVGEPLPAGSLRCELQQWPAEAPWEAPWHPPDWLAAAWAAPLPSLATKLFQESNLREPADRRMA